MADRYTITERVDQGGMAEVFRGVAESMQGFKKSVAIKRILPNLTKNKKFIAMFLDEAKLSLHLQHANIVHVFDVGVSQDAETAYFIVMEFVDGANLKGILDHTKKTGKKLKIGQVLYILIEVCKGLAYAHDMPDPETGKQLGIVHRDISPPNILLSKNGEVKLVDFGLAKATSQLETTDPGVVKGKFSYLSPEAASGTEVDHRADIFAVGILLWEMLTGKRLFYGETDYQTVELVRQAKVPSVRSLNPEVNEELDSVVKKALARDPRDRYQHAADLADALAQVLFSRSMKVTSRDIGSIVREAAADRARNKPVQANNLLDSLILEEMGKFTSLDHLEGGPGGEPAPEHKAGNAQRLEGQRPLDAGSFVDTRGWASDMNEPSRPGPRPTPPQLAAVDSAQSAEAAVDEIDSLQQVLEPDKTGVRKAHDPGNRGVMLLTVVAVVLLMAVGGGLYFFKDRIFGGGNGGANAPSAPR